MKYIAGLSICAAFLLSACHSSSNGNSDEVCADSLTMDSIADVESAIDTNVIKKDADFQTIFRLMGSQRFVRFPRFKASHPQEWAVCNDLYGAHLYTEAYDCPELIDTLIDYRILQYLQTNKTASRQLQQGMTYSNMEKLVNRFRPTDQQDLDSDEEQALPEVDADIELFISCYYQRLLKSMPETRKMVDPLKREHMAWRQFRRSQVKLMEAMAEGNVNEVALSNLQKNQVAHKIEADADMYFSIKNSKYQPTEHFDKIPEKYIYDVYNNYISDIKATKQIGIGPKIQALLAEQKAWLAYIFARKVLSGKLTDDQEVIFDNATNALQKWHIIQLKNRFEGYGYCSDAYRNSLLKENCTYQEMYKYAPMKLGTQF